MSLYLTESLGFSGAFTGLILSLAAASAVVSPLIGSFLADRVISAERLLSLSVGLAAVSLFLLSRTHNPAAVLLLYFSYSLCFGPVMSLNNAVIFHHVPDREKDYGKIRVFGTIGWIAVAWIFSYFRMKDRPERLGEALILGAAVFGATALFTFFAPSSGRKRATGKVSLFPKEAFGIILQPGILGLTAATFLNFMTDRLYFFGAAIFLRDAGFARSSILPALSLGQALEIPAMALLGWFIRSWGLKRVLLAGLAANLCRYGCFVLSHGRPGLIIAGIVFHGLAYTFYFSTAFIVLDAKTRPETRAGAHQIFSVFTTGVGTLAGSLLAGELYGRMTAAFPADKAFFIFWLTAFCLTLVSTGILLGLFRDNRHPKNPPAGLAHAEAE
jgi:MFS family permease